MIAPIHVGPPAELMTFGMELVLDVGACDREALEGDDQLRALAAALVAELGMKAYGPCELWHFGHDDPVTAGYTVEAVASAGTRVRQLIETSSIVFHVSPLLHSAHLNIFSCRQFDPELATRVCLDHLGPDARVVQSVVIVR